MVKEGMPDLSWGTSGSGCRQTWMVLSMEKEKWQHGNGVKVNGLSYYCTRITWRECRSEQSKCEQGLWTQMSGLRVARSRTSERRRERDTGRRRARDRYHRPLVETRDRNPYTEGIPAMVMGFDILAPVDGHLPLMLGCTLRAD